MNLESVRRDDWLLAGVAILLAIDLLAFPWFSFGFGIDLSATDVPDSWAGILAVIAALLLVVDLAVERLSPATAVPAIGGGRTQTRMILAIVAAVFVALKFLLHIHFSIFGWGFYLGIILTVALVYLAAQARRAPAVTVTGPAGPPPAGPPVA